MSSCRADCRQCGFNGRAAESLNPIFIHEGPVKGAHLCLQILWLTVRAVRCFLHDLAELYLGEIIDKHVNGNARFVSRLGVRASQPPLANLKKSSPGLIAAFSPEISKPHVPKWRLCSGSSPRAEADNNRPLRI